MDVRGLLVEAAIRALLVLVEFLLASVKERRQRDMDGQIQQRLDGF